MFVQHQTGALVRIHVATRCLNTSEPVSVRARLESASRGVLFDIEAPRLVMQRREDGVDERRAIPFPIAGGGPFFDLEDAEANLFVTVTDADGTSVSDSVRVRLTSTPVPDLP